MWADTKGTSCLIPLMGSIQTKRKEQRQKADWGLLGAGVRTLGHEGPGTRFSLGKEVLWPGRWCWLHTH